jgi:glutamine synthetase adenylyltransferase
VSETRTKTDIEFIVQFSQPISGKNVPDLIKWTEKIEAQHLINVNVSTRQI